jgi:AmmeMemoRadiSam system protein B
MVISIRKPVVAGMFYPAERVRLLDELNILLSVTYTNINIKNIFGIIVPHAGYIYSGKTAAYAYNLLKAHDIENVIIISPSHREYFNCASVYNGDFFETPLGEIEVNKELAAKIAENSTNIMLGTKGHMQEHAIEVQVPFLQQVLSNFKIVPIVMGDQRVKNAEELAAHIAAVMDDKTIIVASSDLSHYHSRTKADMLDSVVETNIADLNYNGLVKNLDLKNCEACGASAILTLLKAAQIKGVSKSSILHRTDSGDTSGDETEVVGYLSAVLYNE